MTVSSRSDDRCRLRIASLLLSMALASGAMAQGSNEVTRLAEEARQAFISAEQAGNNSKQKTSLYQVARARLKLLEKFAAQDTSGLDELRETARAELDRLADDGLNHDILGSMLLQASLGDLATPQSSADRVELGVELHQIANEQRSLAYRAAAFIEMAYAYNKIGAHDRALRYASLALQAAASIQDIGAQMGAYHAVARLSANLGAPGATIANRALASIADASARANARHQVAREQLKGSAFEKASDAKMMMEARRRLDAGDLLGSASLTSALADGSERENLLFDLLETAIRRQDREIALIAAQGSFDRDRQQNAIAALVKSEVDQGTPLQAAELVNKLEDGPGKASIQLALAAELRRDGYDRMADQLLLANLNNVEAFKEADQKAILPGIVRALTHSDRLDQAITYAERLGSNAEGPGALSGLARRLADQDRLADAEELLPRIPEGDGRSHALSGIGRARARAGEIAGAMQIAQEIANPEDAGHILVEVVRKQSSSGNFGEAISLAGRIEDAEHRLQAFAEISRQATRERNKEVSDKALREAIRVAEGRKSGERDKAFVMIVTTLLEIGRKAQAEELKQRIGDERMLSRAEQRLASAEAKEAVEKKKRGELSETLLKRSLGKVTDDDAKAELAYELSSLPEGAVEAADLVRSIKDDRLRRKTFRRLAELRTGHLMAPSQEEAGDTETVASTADEPGETVQEIQTRRGLALIVTENSKTTPGRVHTARNFSRAPDMRKNIPWPSGAIVGSTFAHHNPYIAKFFEDGPDGATRLEQAIRYQRIPSPRIIVVQSGIATLGMVARQLQGTDAGDLIASEGNVLTVRAPIFVAPGATLILSGLDTPTYRLSADAGAFIANAGNLHVIDAEVVGYDEKSGQPLWSDIGRAGQFRPFLLTWGDGRMNVASSVLTALGYDNARSSGLSYSSGPDRVAELRDQARPTGIVVDNVFRNLYIGFHAYEAEQIQAVGNEYRDSIVYAMDSYDRSKGSIIALNTVYGTMSRHGITISRDVNDSLIVGNLSFDNAGSGIVLDRNSTNNVIQANSSFRNAQDGVTVFESSCNILSNNHLIGNKRDGLKIRNSFDVGAYGNRIESNVNSGVSASIANIAAGKNGEGQNADTETAAPVTALSLRNNRFFSNGVGINAHGVSGLALFSNSFVKQSRRLLGGDVRGLEGPVLRLASQSDVLIASTCRPARPAMTCRLRNQGYFDGSPDLQAFSPQGSPDCTDVNGTVQQKAFANSSQGT